jgi:hypothetical protein
MYSADEIAELLAAVAVAAPDAHADGDRLQEQLADLVNRLGVVRTDRPTPETARAPAPRPAKPSAALIRNLDRLTEAAAAVLQQLDDTEVRQDVRTQLHLRLPGRHYRTKRPTPLGAVTPQLFLANLAFDLAALKTAAEAQATYRKSRRRRGPAPDTVKYGFLVGVAEIFLELTDQEIGFDDLEYGENTPFIRFAQQAMLPFFAPTRVTAKALSDAIARLKYGLPIRTKAKARSQNTSSEPA